MNQQMTEEIQAEKQAILIQNAAFGLLKILGNLISDDGNKTIKSPKFSGESKQKQREREKKRALGIKESPDYGLKM